LMMCHGMLIYNSAKVIVSVMIAIKIFAGIVQW